MVVRKPCAKDANPNPEEGKVDGEVEEVEKVDGEEVEEGASVAAERVRSRVKESPVAREGDEERIDLASTRNLSMMVQIIKFF